MLSIPEREKKGKRSNLVLQMNIKIRNYLCYKTSYAMKKFDLINSINYNNITISNCFQGSLVTQIQIHVESEKGDSSKPGSNDYHLEIKL
jgi:hypothetical protein